MQTSIKEYEDTICMLCSHGFYAKAEIVLDIHSHASRPFVCYYPHKFTDMYDETHVNPILSKPCRKIDKYTIAICQLGNWFSNERA